MIARFGVATTRAEALTALAAVFAEGGIEEPAREAHLTLCAACGLSRADLISAPDSKLGKAAMVLRDFAERRARREPLSRIVGRREFWGLDFAITPDVLDPRPDTETIVAEALAILADRRSESMRILDLGLGSGAVLAALLTEFRESTGVGVDVSDAAARIARRNLERLGLMSRAEVVVGSWTTPVVGRFDLIVSNPPYVAIGDIDGLAPEVRDHDPRVALDGGPDGLAAYRALIPLSLSRLSTGSWLIVEVGSGQSSAVAELFAEAGLLDGAVRFDVSGVARVVLGRTPRQESFGLPTEFAAS